MELQKIYDRITENTTAEEALKDLLRKGMVEYTRLRGEGQDYEVHPTMLIVLATMEMEWKTVLIDSPDDDTIDGMVIGTEDYVNQLLDLPDSGCGCGGGCGCAD